MDYRAAAPAVTAAKRRGVHTAWLVCFSILLVRLTTGAAAADNAPGAGTPTSIDPDKVMQLASADATPAPVHAAASLEKSAASANAADVVNIPQPKPSDRGRAIAVAPTGAAPKALKPTLLFGSLGKSIELSPITRRWQKALADFAPQTASAQNVHLTHPAYTAILKQAGQKRRGLQIPKVNELVNRLLAYREDSALYETGEYWASPTETLAHRAGDCEDFAILKYALLRDLGIADEDMRIVVLRDAALRQFHAVLTVRHKGQWLILDNRFSRVRFERDLPHYKPLYSVNAAGEWTHAGQPGTPVRLAARLQSATR
nr:transglutaminase-like cysteine peptidase [uncultured Roseibium sp.]